MKEWIKNFEKLELFRDIEDDESVEYGFNVLESIFTANESSYGEYLYGTFNQEKLFGKGNYDAIPIGIRDNNINIYKYSFERPNEPKAEVLIQIKKEGRCRADRTAMLYWWLNCFAMERKLELEKAYDYYWLLDDVYVRCGEVTGDIVYRFMIHNDIQYNKLLVFPFLDKKGTDRYKTIDTIDCYLIEFEPKYFELLNKKSQEIINNAVSGIPSLFR